MTALTAAAAAAAVARASPRMGWPAAQRSGHRLAQRVAGHDHALRQPRADIGQREPAQSGLGEQLAVGHGGQTRAPSTPQHRVRRVRAGTSGGRSSGARSPNLAPHQATFALLTTSRSRSSWACLFRQMM